jgi:hypothetical protein
MFIFPQHTLIVPDGLLGIPERYKTARKGGNASKKYNSPQDLKSTKSVHYYDKYLGSLSISLSVRLLGPWQIHA